MPDSLGSEHFRTAPDGAASNRFRRVLPSQTKMEPEAVCCVRAHRVDACFVSLMSFMMTESEDTGNTLFAF